MKKFISKLGIIFLMALVMGIGYGVNAKAYDDGLIGTHNLKNTPENSAKIGDHLLEPEKGWKRYDDKDSRLGKIGDWTFFGSGDAYKGTMSYAKNTKSSLKIKFSGTKIRIIGRFFSLENAKNIPILINIDSTLGEEFNQYNPKSTQCGILNYEKNNLTEGQHEVIINSSYGVFYIDAIDIGDTGSLLPYDSTTLKATSYIEKQVISLNWDKVDGATAYNVKRSTTQGSGYETIASDIKDTTYVDENVQADKTYYYIVTPIIDGKEGTPSNEASATIEKSAEPTKPEPKGDAVLFITMTNGNIKSYNVSMKTVNKFIEWYEDRASGSNGMPFYKFDKTRNEDEIKTEYIVFDKISSFQVEQNK